MIFPKQHGLTLERLRELMAYDEITGNFVWIVRRNSRAGKVIPGQLAGRIANRGNWEIGIDGRNYKRHHLAWFWMTGIWPEHEVDHENNIPHDDVWTNLRAATSTQQKQNTRLRKNSRSGYKGVCEDVARGKWMARITVDKKHIMLGRFDTPEEAYSAYCTAAIKYFGEFARLK